MRFQFIALCALALAACGGGGEAEVAPALPREAGGWVEFTPGAIEIDGRTIEATCSGVPGGDPAFRFWARRGTGDGLVVYFDGGGACWDDATCAQPRLNRTPEGSREFYKAELMAGDVPAQMDGIFDLDNPRNPVRDWSFVFVPYCTGDVHSGANTAHYTNPATNEPYTIEHRGSDNARVILEWMRANFDAPGQLLVTGSSAGAYGAATHYGRIREAFPSGRALMLGDAGQGVTAPGFLQQRNENWGYDLPANVFGENASLTDDEDIVARLAAHFPQDRFAQYTTAHDDVQVAFYALMGVPNTCAAWTEAMDRDLARRQGASNFHSYLAAGETHTILRSPLFYTEESAGQPFAEWLGAELSEAGAANAACEQCLTPRANCPY